MSFAFEAANIRSNYSLHCLTSACCVFKARGTDVPFNRGLTVSLSLGFVSCVPAFNGRDFLMNRSQTSTQNYRVVLLLQFLNQVKYVHGNPH